MFRAAIVLCLCLTISTASGQLDIADDIAGGITEGLIEGVVEALVGNVPVAGDITTSVIEDAPIAEVVTPVLEVLGTATKIASDPADVVENLTGSDVGEDIPITETSVGPVLEMLGTGGDVSGPANVVETITDSDVVENLPIAQVSSVEPVLETLGFSDVSGGPTTVVDTVTGSNVAEDLPVDDVIGENAPASKITARTLLRLILMRRLGMLKS